MVDEHDQQQVGGRSTNEQAQDHRQLVELELASGGIEALLDRYLVGGYLMRGGRILATPISCLLQIRGHFERLLG